MNENKNNKDEVDLSGMLNGYSKKAEQFQIWQEQTNQKSQKNSLIIRLLIKYSGGLIKNETQANYVFLGVTFVAVTISFFLIFGRGKAKLSPEEQMFQNIKSEII